MLERYQLFATASNYSDHTITLIRLSLRYLEDFLSGIPDVRKVKADDLRRLIVHLKGRTKYQGTPQKQDRKLSDTTLNTYVRSIKAFWSWLKEEEIIKNNPLRDVKSPKLSQRLPKTLTEAELVAVFKAAAGHPREIALMMLILDTGVSLSEIEGLNDTDADTKNGTLRVYRKKTRKERSIFFNLPTAYAIETYRHARPAPVAEPRLFLTRDGRPLKGGQIQQLLERIGGKAGISKRLAPHKLRHTFATMSLAYGSNLEYLRIMLGHTDIRTTARSYLHATEADVAARYKTSSPVVNLDIGQIPGRPSKTQIRGDIKRETTPAPPAEGDWIMPIVYSKVKKEGKRKTKKRQKDR
jgi:integrase/recombinase XerD